MASHHAIIYFLIVVLWRNEAELGFLTEDLVGSQLKKNQTNKDYPQCLDIHCEDSIEEQKWLLCGF